jgi:S-layer homology domain
MGARIAARLAAVVLFACLASPSLAQPAGNVPEEFGTQDGIDLWIPASQFTAAVLSRGWSGCNLYYCESSEGTVLEAPLLLPQGAYVDSWRVFYYDNSPNNISVSLNKVYDDTTGSGSVVGSQQISLFISSGTPGFANHRQVEGWTVDLREPRPGSSVTREQAADFYSFEVIMPADTQVWLKGIRVIWHRQISPAPATATFNDVPTTDPGFQYIEALVASGVTAGCNTAPPMYCPDATLTRRQMAIFLAKALGLHWPNF